MYRERTKEDLFPQCPVRHIIARISDKWSMLALSMLGTGTMRFSELRREMPDISQKVLTSTLRTLEQDGYVRRTVYASVPPRVEYSLTARGQSLLPHIDALVCWAKENMAGILKDRQANGKA